MRLSILAVGTLGLALAAAGCGGDSGGGGGDNGTGGSGAGGSGAGGKGSGGSGAGGMSGGAGGMSGGTFMVVKPCLTEDAYKTGTTVTFPMTATDVGYTPKCLKVKVGDTVKFTGSFMDHPLKASAKRGDQDGNPITETKDGTSASFKFDKAGYFGYTCEYHGGADTGTDVQMVGVIWVAE